MSKDSKNLVTSNLAFWVVAGLLHPLSRVVPTESGEPPKFFSFLIPLMFAILAVASTAMISKAMGERTTQ